jgi:hypothetical protein
MAYGLEAANSPTGRSGSFAAGAYFIFASVALLLALGDVRMLRRGGVFGKDRIGRHLLRMGLAMFIAFASFFLGQQQVFPPGLRNPLVLNGPVLLVVGSTLYWLVRVRVAKHMAGLYVLRTHPASAGG